MVLQGKCERDDIDLVYVATDWKHHAEMGVYAMEHGKHVAIEVPAAMTLDEIWWMCSGRHWQKRGV